MCSGNGSELGSVPGSLPSFACKRRKCSHNRSNQERLKMCSRNGSELVSVARSLPSFACERNSLGTVLVDWIECHLLE